MVSRRDDTMEFDMWRRRFLGEHWSLLGQSFHMQFVGNRRTQESDMKTAEKKRRSDKIAELESQKKSTSGELEKTNQYLVDLKPACVNTDGGATYDDRKAARTQEVEALKKAQGILEDAFKQKASFLQVRRQ